MNKSNLLQWCLYLLLFTACNNDTQEESFFNGELRYATSFLEHKKVFADNVTLDEINDDRMIVCDSFLLFESPKYNDYWFYVFNKKSGKLVGKLCPKGEGPNDFRLCIDSEQFITNSSNEIQLWVREPYRSSQLINITRSVREGVTICDSIVPMKWMEKFQFPAPAMFFLDDSLILAKSQCEDLSIDDGTYTPGQYFLYKDSLEHLLRAYVIYRKPILPTDPKDGLPSAVYYASYDRIKPDGSKVVMAMRSVGQINILDVSTGELIGIRQQGSVTFKSLENSKQKYMYYYTTVAVDDQYIFAAYSGTIYTGGYPEPAHEVHVFNWEGDGLCRITIDEPIFCVSYDSSEQKLYATDFKNNVWSYDMSFLYE